MTFSHFITRKQVGRRCHADTQKHISRIKAKLENILKKITQMERVISGFALPYIWHEILRSFSPPQYDENRTMNKKDDKMKTLIDLSTYRP